MKKKSEVSEREKEKIKKERNFYKKVIFMI
jgi:hypothetical protein